MPLAFSHLWLIDRYLFAMLMIVQNYGQMPSPENQYNR